MTTQTALPTEDRPIRMDPELAERVEEMLANFKGKEREKAQAAVKRVYDSSVTGRFHELVEAYEAAILEAVTG